MSLSKRFALSLVSVAVMSVGNLAFAHSPIEQPVYSTPALRNTQPNAGALANIEVRDRDTGATLPIYRRNGNLYVAGTPGHRYAISLRNQLASRGLFVVSVDGVNALTGETASFAQSGYVLDRGQSFDVNGWRKSTYEVANFTFTALPNSYAARTGRPMDVGAIGVALFREAAPVSIAPPEYPRPRIGREGHEPVPYDQQQGGPRMEQRAPEAATRSMPAPMPPSANAESAMRPDYGRQDKLGTGHGERETSVMQRTHFHRASNVPDEVITIMYDSFENLVAQGVIPRPQRHARHFYPRPFPAQPVADSRGFVPDPWHR